MCGISGIVGPAAERPRLDDMLLLQQHRGPDHTGRMVKEGQVALGHNRLAIIDLSEEANQPFRSNNGRYDIVFNGEIYNYLELRNELRFDYQFKTTSDTEVLLAAYTVWGESMLEKLNGMFAFAIYDHLEDSLFAARDRFGVKPFYYMLDQESFYFASEIKAFSAGGMRLRPRGSVWAQYLCHGSYGMPHETFWEDVNQLEAGHSLNLKGSSSKIRRWYNFEQRVKQICIRQDVTEIMDEYELLLEESVRLRFRADVEVGFNLSGGLDSSTLLSLVNRIFPNNTKIRAYSFYTGDPRYDEIPWVEKMLEATGNPLEKVLLQVEEVPELARHFATIQDEPYGGIPTIAYGRLFQAARQNGTIVLLDGQGMDEQWAGYDYYTSVSESTVQGTKSSPTRSNVLKRDFALSVEKPKYPSLFNSRLQNLQYRDLFYTKIPRALRFNDRVSMAASVELREPFLDYRMVEYAFAQPDELKIRDGKRKWVLRAIAEKHLSSDIATAPKRPLQTPQREWLGDDLAFFVEDQIARIDASPFREWFEMDALRDEWNLYTAGQRDNAFYIWQWVSVGMLARNWK